ncbi:MAG: hypothetical protein K2M60_03830 [Lachnospiraceae bacterium]|nr:hypothetical protein [Lachnospiraceae bacterium]MDE6252763.1 hypothetical protein [Lachnospiraceae bacterium]
MMGINIGNGNKIKNPNIAETIEGCLPVGKKRFYDKHPWISGLAITFIIGFICFLLCYLISVETSLSV